MAASVTQVKTGLKNALASYMPAGVRTYATSPAKPEPPALCVLGPTSWTYDTTFDGDVLWAFEVGVYLSVGTDLTRAQTALDAFLAPTGSSSIRAALVADTTLGGTVSFARAIGGNEYARLVDVAGTQLLYASVNVETRSV